MARHQLEATRFGITALRRHLGKAPDPLGPGSNGAAPAGTGHADGQRLIREVMTIRSSLTPAALQEGLVRGLALPRERPAAARVGLLQGPITSGYVQFGSGTEPDAQFVAGMRLTATGNGGCTLTYAVETWTVSDGVVSGIPQLKLLCRRIEEEARKLDPLIVVTVAVREPQEQH